MARKSRKTIEENPQAMPVAETVYKTGIYGRLSIEDTRDGEGSSLEDQICLGEKYVSEKPYLTLAGVYSDNGLTGTNFERPDFERLMEDVRKGKINCIVVKDLSRFGRNYIEADHYIEKVFPFLGVRFIAIGEGFDSHDPRCSGDGLTIAVKNLINDIYARDISQKCKTALNRKMKKGEFLGSHAPFGYAKSPENKNLLIIDEEAAAIVRDVFQWKLEGMTVAGITKKLNIQETPSPSTYRRVKYPTKGKKPARDVKWQENVVKKMLVNMMYLGHMVNGMSVTHPEHGYAIEKLPRDQWIVVKNTHEPIIAEQDFEAVAEIFRETSERYYANTGKYSHLPTNENVLMGVVYCGICGRALKRVRNVSFNREYITHTYFCRYCGSYEAESSRGGKRIKEPELLDTVNAIIRKQIELCIEKESLFKRLRVSSAFTGARRGKDAEIEALRLEIRRKETRIVTLCADKCDGLFTGSEFIQMKQAYEREKAALAVKLEELLAEREQFSPHIADDNQYLAAFRAFYDENDLTREMLLALVERIEVASDKEISIVFKHHDEFEDFVRAVRECEAFLLRESEATAV